MTVMTQLLPAGTFPAAWCLSSPATPAAEAGSTNTPSFAESQRWASRISSSVTESIIPPDSSRAASACSHEAGLPIRMAVAIVSGSVTGWPWTIGAAPAAWKPHITGVFVATAGSSASEAPSCGFT